VAGHRRWHSAFAQAGGAQEGGQAVHADAGQPCLVRRGEMEKTPSRRTMGVGDALRELQCCRPHGEHGEWGSVQETLANRLRPLGPWIPGKFDDGESLGEWDIRSFPLFNTGRDGDTREGGRYEQPEGAP
jgi:hypothetical protein